MRSLFTILTVMRLRKNLKEIKWDAQAAEKAGFEHFMMKEIHEQPKASKGYAWFSCQGWKD